MNSSRWYLLGTGLTLILFITSLFLGSVSLQASDVWSSLIGQGSDEITDRILLSSRLPRALTAILVGISLALSGLLMQTLFRNPLAGPSVLGISSGASLGVGLVTMATTAWGISFWSGSVVVGALLGSFAVLLLILWVSQRLRSATTLLIFGLMLGYVTSAVLGILQYSTSQEALRSFVVWGLGSFEHTSMREVMIIAVICFLGVVVILRNTNALNLLTLGEAYAITMGVNVKRQRWFIIGVTGLLTGIATAYCGPVAFLGLAIPHVARMIWRTQNMLTLIPATMFSGAFIGLFCDVICRLPGVEGAIPLNAVTSFIGAPVIVAIIWSGKFWRKAL